MKMEQAKKEYQSTAIPPELSRRMEEAIGRGERKKSARWRCSAHGVRRLALASISCAVLLIFSVNANAALASGLYEIPVIGAIARVFTFREYKENDEVKVINAKIPAIHNTGNTELETRINYDILKKMNAVVEQAESMAQEYYDAFIATGGKKEEFIPMEIDLNYDIKCSDDNLLSFIITESQVLANCWVQNFYYNIDLETGKTITLEHLFGKNYKEIVNGEVNRQIAQRKEADENALFFEGEDGFQTISANQSFYIRGDRTVVVVFEKYEIAPGYMGTLEFPIAY